MITTVALKTSFKHNGKTYDGNDLGRRFVEKAGEKSQLYAIETTVLDKVTTVGKKPKALR
eukprot:6591348-Pyramimonas_sp.AAC.1